MQEIKDMKEVGKGIYEPTELYVIANRDDWVDKHVGYGYVLDIPNNKVAYVFKLQDSEDIVAFTQKHYPESNVGYHRGIPDLGDFFLGGLF